MKSSEQTVELQAKEVSYFSRLDEDAFFAWLDKLSCVEGYVGRGRILYITVRTAAVDECGLRELLALFRRYGVDLQQLSIFDREEFATWFRNKEAYWYNSVFG